jgi:hypothetical protein
MSDKWPYCELNILITIIKGTCHESMRENSKPMLFLFLFNSNIIYSMIKMGLDQIRPTNVYVTSPYS